MAAVLEALEAALEVNSHLNDKIEIQTTRLVDTEKELEGYKKRCEQLSHLVDDRLKPTLEDAKLDTPEVRFTSWEHYFRTNRNFYSTL